MGSVTIDSLLPLEVYARRRAEFRAQIIEYKKQRTVAVGDHVTLIFEDETTMRYQIQEMLRVERIFEPEGINEELDAYNPLIPDGSNWKATMMIEYPDIEERQVMLQRLNGIERRVWVQIKGHERAYAIADEDLERANEEKTSAVHFLRFELSGPMKQALWDGAALELGIAHSAYTASVIASPDVRASLIKDLQA